MDNSNVIHAARVHGDLPLDLDVSSNLWSNSTQVQFDTDNYGRRVRGMRTTVYSAWTPEHLDLLFICPFLQLNLKPQPETSESTPQLWNWDVAELFICPSEEQRSRYKEFEVSPQAEWLDLDIDLAAADHIGDPKWSSGFKAEARIDHNQNIWYGAMRIPFASVSTEPVAAGTIFRANLFRSQGPDHQLLAWQPSMSETFHVPERFGQLILVE